MDEESTLGSASRAGCAAGPSKPSVAGFDSRVGHWFSPLCVGGSRQPDRRYGGPIGGHAVKTLNLALRRRVHYRRSP